MKVPHIACSCRRGGRHGRRIGLSLIEVTVATGIVGLLIVASLETLGAVTRASRVNATLLTAELLARDLMAEVLAVNYRETTDQPAAWGPEVSERGGTRELFDDVDDYDAWSASPPVSKTGAVRVEQDGWRRDVTVRYVQLEQVRRTATRDEGLKEITVSVHYLERRITELVTLRGKLD